MPVMDDVREVIEVIKKSGNPDAVILFGSVAREAGGNAIDLLIAGKKKDGEKVTKSLSLLSAPCTMRL
jgi:predicted nucleotidyltransferase